MDAWDSRQQHSGRAAVEEQLTHELNIAKNKGDRIAVFFINLDRFKFITEMLGESASNQVIELICNRIKENIPTTDRVIRIDEDEFIIILHNIIDRTYIKKMVVKIFDYLQKPFVVQNQDISITVSLGIAVSPESGEDGKTLLKNAALAMHHIKMLGGNQFEFSTPDMSKNAQERLELESALHNALKQNEFLLYYQPKIDLVTGAMIGTEALLRWQRHGYGLMLPQEFIPIAEETGLIVAISEWVLREACQQNKIWQKLGRENFNISINTSAKQFQDTTNIVQLIQSVLDESLLNPNTLELEITETLLMQNIDVVAESIIALKNMGIQISIDDFGTGYSSFSYLKRFSVDRIKIDRTFIKEIPYNKNDVAITNAMIAMAHKLGYKVLAEGVETRQQIEFLIENGCDEFQGYYFSPPVLGEEISHLLLTKRMLVIE